MNRIELETALVKKAREDGAFRQQLIEDPARAVEVLTGVSLPPELEIAVVEETDQHLYLVLPATSAGSQELSEADLAGVAGGNNKPDKELTVRRRHPYENRDQPL